MELKNLNSGNTNDEYFIEEPLTMKNTQDEETERPESKLDLLYTISEIPPWYFCILLGLQHYLTMVGATIAVPVILSKYFCIHTDFNGLSELIGTVLFVCGVATLMQTTFGVRLPIVQGTTFAFLSPTIAILSLDEWICPYENNKYNITLPLIGSPEHKTIWRARIREIQGAILISSLFQVVIGFTGLIGVLTKFIGPLVVAPTVTMVGLSIFPAAADKCASQWWTSIMTIFFIVMFSQYLRNINIPLCRGRKLPVFKLFPIILGMGLSWLICYILTVSGALPTNSTRTGYYSRTDLRTDVIHKAPWFDFPYPGQWGRPTVNVASVFGMLAGVIASMVESVGDYYACARLSGAPPPPNYAINRGIGIEGVGCIVAGLWGTGNGTTSFSENIGAIGITKVGSRVVIQTGAAIMLILGCLGKFSALFVTIPDPIIGGLFMVTFGLITAVGLSNLQFVDLNSSRNLFVLGFSLFFGLSFPMWLSKNQETIDTGNAIANQIITILLSTNMLVAGIIAFVLDNTIPGTQEERGLKKWKQTTSLLDVSSDNYSCYDIPLVQKYFNRIYATRYLPFCSNFALSAENDTHL